MWPWEHLAFGYLLYSLSAHLRYRRPPSDGPVLVLALGTQIPDIIDKPLAWGFQVLPHGYSLAHSLLFAVPLLGGVVALLCQFGDGEYGIGLAIGYLSHLLGDVLYGLFTGGTLSVSFLFWPLISRPPGTSVGFLLRVEELFGDFLSFLATPLGMAYLLLEVVTLLLVLTLWMRDGRPGLDFTRIARKLFRMVVR